MLAIIWILFYFIIFKKCLFLRETVWAGEGGREGDTESEAGSRLEHANHKIMTQVKVGRSTDWATQAPHFEFCFKLHDNLMSNYYYAILHIRRLKLRVTHFRWHISNWQNQDSNPDLTLSSMRSFPSLCFVIPSTEERQQSIHSGTSPQSLRRLQPKGVGGRE